MSQLPTEIRLRVRDLDRSVEFYRGFVGLPLELSDPHPPENEVHHETMWGDFTTSYQFFTLYAAMAEEATTRVLLSFPVGDLDELHIRAVERGIPVVSAPHENPWGREAQYRDPDGNVVCLSESAHADDSVDETLRATFGSTPDLNVPSRDE